MIEARSWGWYPAPLPSKFIQNAVPILCTLLVVIKIALTTEFHRFLARFSGRRRRVSAAQSKLLLPLNSWRILLVVLIALSNFNDACSSRSIPKPRIVSQAQPTTQVITTTTSTSTTIRPNITFTTYACNDRYRQFYCLNGATCFTVLISGSVLYNCECTTGYWGQRCEYKNLEGTYNTENFYLNASTASGVSIGIFMFVIIGGFVYQVNQRKKKRKALIKKLTLTSISKDCVDGSLTAQSFRLNYREPIFGTRWKRVQQTRFVRAEIQFPTKLRSALKSRTAAIYPQKKYCRRFFAVSGRNLRQGCYQLPQVPPPSPHFLSVSDQDLANSCCNNNNNNNTLICINNNQNS